MKSMIPNDYGKIILVENCLKIDINEFVREYRFQMKRAAISTFLEPYGLKLDLTVTTTGYGGKRIWFKCPMCARRIGMLYQHPISQLFGCRECLSLKYRKRRFKGMVENETLR